MRRLRRVFTVLAFALAASVSLPAAAAADTYSNISRIDLGVFDLAGPGSPYPTGFAIDGQPGPVAGLKVLLPERERFLSGSDPRGIKHEYPQDIDVLLVGPGGQKSIVMSDTCGITPVTGLLLTLDEAAPSPLPSTTCASGSYKPANLAPADSFPPPAPPGPYTSGLSVFNGGPLNGRWDLWVVDDTAFDRGSVVGGWALEFLPQASCAGAAASVASHVGSSFGDTVTGTAGPDVLMGLGSDDKLNGLGGNDIICGGPGKDKLRGGAGNDLILGEGGKDKLVGGPGRDRCRGGPAKDQLKSCP